MAPTRINVPALYAALDGARKTKNLSWRQLAGEVGCSPSTMTRLANGYRPDADAFMSLARWLKMPAETFWLGDDAEEGSTDDERPALLAELGVLLRARPDIDDEEKARLENVLSAAMGVNATRRASRDR